MFVVVFFPWQIQENFYFFEFIGYVARSFIESASFISWEVGACFFGGWRRVCEFYWWLSGRLGAFVALLLVFEKLFSGTHDVFARETSSTALCICLKFAAASYWLRQPWVYPGNQIQYQQWRNHQNVRAFIHTALLLLMNFGPEYYCATLACGFLFLVISLCFFLTFTWNIEVMVGLFLSQTNQVAPVQLYEGLTHPHIWAKLIVLCDDYADCVVDMTHRHRQQGAASNSQVSGEGFSLQNSTLPSWCRRSCHSETPQFLSLTLYHFRKFDWPPHFALITKNHISFWPEEAWGLCFGPRIWTSGICTSNYSWSGGTNKYLLKRPLETCMTNWHKSSGAEKPMNWSKWAKLRVMKAALLLNCMEVKEQRLHLNTRENLSDTQGKGCWFVFWAVFCLLWEQYLCWTTWLFPWSVRDHKHLTTWKNCKKSTIMVKQPGKLPHVREHLFTSNLFSMLLSLSLLLHFSTQQSHWCNSFSSGRPGSQKESYRAPQESALPYSEKWGIWPHSWK